MEDGQRGGFGSVGDMEEPDDDLEAWRVLCEKADDDGSDDVGTTVEELAVGLGWTVSRTQAACREIARAGKLWIAPEPESFISPRRARFRDDAGS